MLLARGADARAYKSEALRWSARNGHAEIVNVLLKWGTEVHHYRHEALQWSVENDHTEIVDTLLMHGIDTSERDWALLIASRKGYLKTLRVLLKHGANANINYSLECACRNGHICIVEELLQNGINLDGYGRRSLLFSIQNGRLDIAKLLLENGASLYHEDNKILVDLQNVFNMEVADLIFPYCDEDDHKYLPSDYIETKFVPTKSARNI